MVFQDRGALSVVEMSQCQEPKPLLLRLGASTQLKGWVIPFGCVQATFVPSVE